MKHSALFLLVLLVVTGLALADDPGPILARLERHGTGDLATLRAAGLPVVLETNHALFVQGDDATLERAARLGFAATAVDRAEGPARYVHVGLRTDSDRAAVESAGTVVWAEENWMLLRVPESFDPERLAAARVFLAPVPARPLDAPAPAPVTAPLAAPNPLVQQIVDGVLWSDIENYWVDLTSNPPSGTRYSYSQGCRDAGTYCHNEMEALKIPAEFQNYNASYAPNVIGTQLGGVTPDRVYIVIGHLDDLPSSGLAPGADDNASGAVNVLASAKALACYAFKSTIKYIDCTGEEQGLVGSDAYAQDALNRHEDVRGVLNMDMIAWAGNGSPNPENLDVNYNGPSQWLGELFHQSAIDYNTGLAVDDFYCPSLTASDHASFWERGWPAICGITDNEGYCGHGGNYPYYHTSDDTIAHCGDHGLFYSTVKTSVATLATMAEPFKVTFDRNFIACGGTATLVVGDRDLDQNPAAVETVAAEVWSTTEPEPEVVTLTEQGLDSMMFSGTVVTASVPPVHGDGVISTNPGDTVSARYVDALDCNGATGVTYTTSASTDCTAPVISNVHHSGVTENSATVAWTTDEASDSTVTWGEQVPPTSTTTGPAGVTDHEVPLTGLQSCTAYYYAVRSADVAGNVASSDNGGVYYHFETLGDFGSGPQPCHQGRLTLSKDVVGCSDTLVAQVVDMDLNVSATAVDTVAVTLTSDTETTPELVTLTETGANTSVFTANVALAPGPAVPGDGIVQAADGDVITGTYHDADDGTGHAGLSFDTAVDDCAAPGVNPVQVTDITDEGATVRFTTSEPTTGQVEWGTTETLGRTASDPTLATSHALPLSPIAECGRIYFRVTATDALGNTSVVDQQGRPFAFNGGIIPGLWRDNFETLTGWTLDGEWQIGAPQGKGTSPGDPTAAFAGTGVLGHDLTGLGAAPGDYERNKTERAVSPAITGNNLTKSEIKFRRWLNTGSGGVAYVEVKIGAASYTVWSSDNTTESAWGLQTVSLSPFADGSKTFSIVFRQSGGTGPGATRAGWNIDRLVVRSGDQPVFDVCGACGGAPAFEGAQSASDADACANTGVNIAWKQAPAWGTGRGGTYAVYRDTVPDFVPSSSNRLAAGLTTTSYADTSAAADATLFYLVRAENDETCGSGPANHGVTDANTVHAAVTTTSSRPLPAPITQLAATRLNDVHVRLAWPTSAGAAGYNVYRSGGPQPGGFARIGDTSALAFDDPGEGATANTWFYLVRPANACGQETP